MLKRLKKGNLTLLAALIVVFCTPLFLFVGDWGLRVYLARDLRGALDNASLTAATHVDYDGTGRLFLNEEEAEREAREILADTLGDGVLDDTLDDGEALEGTVLAEKPHIDVYLVTPEPGETIEFGHPSIHHTRQGSVEQPYEVTSPSVFIYVETMYRRPLLGMFPDQPFNGVSGAEVIIVEDRNLPTLD